MPSKTGSMSHKKIQCPFCEHRFASSRAGDRCPNCRLRQSRKTVVKQSGRFVRLLVLGALALPPASIVILYVSDRETETMETTSAEHKSTSPIPDRPVKVVQDNSNSKIDSSHGLRRTPVSVSNSHVADLTERPSPISPTPTAEKKPPDKSSAVLQAELEQLGIHCRVDDDGRIVEADLSAGVTDDHLLSLRQAHELQCLRLIGCRRITANGFSALQSFPDLKAIYLNRSSVSDDALINIGTRQHLETLDLDYCQAITDRGLVHLKRLKNLTTLFLNGTSITDKGVQHLQELKRLRTVSLSRTKVTRASIGSLVSNSQLKKLYLFDTGFTPDDIVVLNQRLPNCEVFGPTAEGR